MLKIQSDNIGRLKNICEEWLGFPRYTSRFRRLETHHGDACRKGLWYHFGWCCRSSPLSSRMWHSSQLSTPESSDSVRILTSNSCLKKSIAVTECLSYVSAATGSTRTPGTVVTNARHARSRYLSHDTVASQNLRGQLIYCHSDSAMRPNRIVMPARGELLTVHTVRKALVANL